MPTNAQLTHTQIVEAWQTRMLPTESFERDFARLKDVVIPAKLLVAHSNNRLVEITHHSDNGFVLVDKEVAEESQTFSNNSFQMIENIPSITLSDSEIEALAQHVTVTLPGLEGFNTAWMLLTQNAGESSVDFAKRKLSALPTPLIQKDLTTLDEKQKHILDVLNAWHESIKINDVGNIDKALAEIAYSYDPVHNRLTIRQAPVNARNTQEAIAANQLIDNLTEALIKHLGLAKPLQIHHCIPWVQEGWLFDHIILKIKTEIVTENSRTYSEKPFDPQWGFKKPSQTIGVQAPWNWNDCGRYVTLGATTAALILANRGTDPGSLTSNDLKAYRDYIKSADACENPAALKARLLQFKRISPAQSPTLTSPLESSPPKSSSDDEEQAPYAAAVSAVSQASFWVAQQAAHATALLARTTQRVCDEANGLRAQS